jgi:hypothetical protein
MKNTLFILAIICFVYYFSGCGDEVKPGGGGGDEIDTNILRTDAFCNILGGDTNDWCFDTTGTFSFGPACPNPSISTTIRFYLPQPDTIKLTIRNSLGGADSVLFDGPLPMGEHQRDIVGTNYLNTFRKVCITSKHYSPGTGCSFCGDIKFEQ